MKFEDNKHISGDGVYYEGVIRDIKRSKTSLQPVYEAFTNSLEAVKIKENLKKDFKGKIEIKIFSIQNTDQSFTFSKLQISDNGIGFDNKEFKRFNTYKDFTKGFKNLGSGRIQYAHYFDTTKIKSKYRDNGSYREREFFVSKKDNYLKNNSIIFHKSDIKIDADSSGTVLTFEGLLDPTRNIYHTLNDVNLKDAFIKRYVQYFC